MSIQLIGNKQPTERKHNMATYLVNKQAQSNGDHEVHVTTCQWLPSPENRLRLGEFLNCRPAVEEAKKHYRQSNGCKHCCLACHTS